ncbi:transketolase family protein [Candidatus Bathyarchaeota archaeon]|nr:MAG: transketolase [Candidatus Bathyarchaeota archaeon ex4484_40]RJS68033.1 MAG: transketolase family protein [Candidatus Bathyarchaeota archaeon]RJS79972.1 MAG: transketolase family protein [Candidatus Bathyarchaeota archaeon]
MREKAYTRDAYGRTLVELGRTRKEIVVLDADLSTSTRTAWFGREFPDRFFNFGVAEANMMSAAAGLASSGKIPFVSTFAVFATGRAYNQYRTSIAYPNLNVKIVATHSGISVGEDGPTHFCIEDIAIMRALPNTTVLVPADAVETEAAVKAAVDHYGPVYIRLSRPKLPVIYEEGYRWRGEKLTFRIGGSVTLREGEDVTLVASGLMVSRALDAAEALAREGIEATVIDLYSIKPIDREALTEAARRTGAIVTCEEHNVCGGVGSAVAEVLVETVPVPMEMVGVKDTFAESGSMEDLLTKYGLTSKDIVEAAKRVIKRKT